MKLLTTLTAMGWFLPGRFGREVGPQRVRLRAR